METSDGGRKYSSFWLTLQPSQGLRFQGGLKSQREQTKAGFYWSISNRGWGSRRWGGMKWELQVYSKSEARKVRRSPGKPEAGLGVCGGQLGTC